MSARTERNYSPRRQWLSQLGDVHQFDPFDPSNLSDIPAWRQRVRSRLTELLGPMPIPVALNLDTIAIDQEDGYRREKIVFDSEAMMSVPAYLLIPDERETSGAAVLAIHGHGPGKDHVSGLVVTEAPNSDYAVQLVKAGFVVLAPDLRCFGERKDDGPDDHYACDTNLVSAVIAGQNPLSQNIFDLIRCIDVLSAHPLVDATRIGVAGLSYGGTLSLFLSALDDRIVCSVVSGYLSSLAASHAVDFNMCGSQILYGMLGRIEHLDVASLVAPRPMCVESGEYDPIFAIDAARATMLSLGQIYSQLGAPPGALVHDVFPGGHQWHGEVAIPFLVDHLTSGGVCAGNP